ncbi:glycosyltransferase family 39 protein [Acetivibrio cellulolyticus]
MLPLNSFAQGENLANNPEFEQGSIDTWISECWDKNEGVTQFSLDETQVHSGSKSALIVNNSANDSRYKQTINVKANTYYRMSCWIKTVNIGSEQKGANLSIENSLDSTKDIKGTSNYWEYVELYGKTSPNQQSFTLTLGIGGYGSTNTGKAWFDSVEVVELDSLPPGKTSVSMDPNWNSHQNQSANSTVSPFLVGFIVLMAGIIFSALFIIYKDKNSKIKSAPKIKTKTLSDFDESALPARSQLKKVRFDKKDFLIMASMSLIYLLVALFNLGDLKVPTTSWLPSKVGENFTVDLGKDTTLSRIYFNLGLGSDRDASGKYTIEYLDGQNGFVHLASFVKEDIFSWKYIETAPVKTRQLKFIVDDAGGTLNEIGIFEYGSTKPLQGITIIKKNVNENSKGSIENLFDEQNLVVFKPSYKNSMYFDEVYHARTAYEHINKIEPYETTHPPLGKVILSLGLLIFGMVPFGWRIMGTLFGAAMIPVMYAFGKKIFHKRFYAFCSAFLMMFEFMHFSQTRIATIDSYVTLFIILMYYYMYDYFTNKSYVLGFKASLKPLFLSGLFFGLGAASKWIAFYGAAGLALLFFVTKISEFNDYKKLIAKEPQKGSWVYRFFPLYVNSTVAYCVFAFILMPLIIYTLSYIPWMQVPGEGHGLNLFYDNSVSMFNYHSNLVDDHPYQSSWWEWPIMVKPMAFYFGSDLEPDMASKIFTMGNPAIWWTGILVFVIFTVFALSKLKKYYVPIFITSAAAFAFTALPGTLTTSVTKFGRLETWWMAICATILILLLILSKFDKKQLLASAASYIGFIIPVLLFYGAEKNLDFYKQLSTRLAILIFLAICISILFRGIYKYDRKLLVIMAAIVFQYIPWIFITRVAFIYHYFSIVPFLILSIVYIINIFVDKYPKGKFIAYVYLGLVFALFVLYYPGLSGLEVPIEYMGNLKWFGTWYF